MPLFNIKRIIACFDKMMKLQLKKSNVTDMTITCSKLARKTLEQRCGISRMLESVARCRTIFLFAVFFKISKLDRNAY